MELFKEFTFEAAHRLPNAPDGHKCARLHGHSFHIAVHVKGAVNDKTGWVMDFGEIKNAVQPFIEQLDHTYLNEIEGLENPTSEHIAMWLWRKIIPKLPQLSRITVRETCTTACVYDGK